MSVRLTLGTFVLAGFLVSAFYVRQRDPPAPAAEGSPLDSLIVSGEAHYWEGEFEEAESIWLNALDRSRETGNAKVEARVLTWLGLAAYRTGEYSDARRLGEEALALKLRLGPGVELAKSYNALGLLAWNEGRLVEATQLFRQANSAATEEGDEEIAAKSTNNLGLVYSDLGEFARARASFEASLDAGRELGDTLIQGRTFSNLGMLEIRTGDPVAGMRFLSQARLLYRSSGDIAGEVNTLGQLATAYAAVGEPRRAFAVLDSSLTLSRRHELRSEEASSLELLAGMYAEAGDHRRALDLYERARALNHELGLQIEEGNDLRHEASIHARLGNLARARSLADQAADVHRTTGSAVDELTDLLFLAELDQLSGRPSEAQEHLELCRDLADQVDTRAVRRKLALSEARIADHSADSRRVLGVLTEAMPYLLGSYASLWEAEALRARAHARLGDLEAAAAAGYRAVAAVERVRERFGSGFLRTAFLADRQVAYTDLIDVLLRQGKAEEAFEIADAARGRAFLEYLVGAPVIAANNDSMAQSLAEGERLLREIDELVVRGDEIESLPPEERGPMADRLAQKLRETRGRYEELLIRLSERDAEVAALLGGHRIRSVEVRQSLRPDEVLLEYVVTADRVIVFAVRRNGVESFTSATPMQDVVRRVRVAHELASRPGAPNSASAVLESLYGILIEPVSSAGIPPRARRLIIVPDAALGHVPFAALRDPNSGEYLAERYAISHLPTAAAIPLLRRQSRYVEQPGSGTRPVSVFVPLPEDLPATRLEAQEIRRTLGTARVIEGRDATEEKLRQELSTGRIIHVASHGALDASNPLFSRIELSRGSDRSTNDGQLDMHEILGLAIRSPLVFLSGCETEMGAARSSTFAVGDDYATLARAFLYAGAQTVVATAWRIDDQGAAIFAARFYDHLRESLPDEALALTQRDLIRSERYSAPYYWASYRLAGEGAARY